MTPVVPARPLLVAIVLAALAGGAIVIAVELTSDHQTVRAVWATFAPAVGWSFIGTGPLRVAAPAGEPHRRAHDPAGLRVVRLHAAGLELASGLHRRAGRGRPVGAIFLHLGLSFPTGG
jgi:hypothetical protein